MKGISRVLIANRGEIAVRVIRACRELGIESVVAVSEEDRESLPTRLADRTVCIGPPPPIESYLMVGTIITAARGTGADAIHPGYGFLAEQSELPDACETHGLIFIGPTAENIRKMGDKLWAREMVKELGIPVIPGSELVVEEQNPLRVVLKRTGAHGWANRTDRALDYVIRIIAYAGQKHIRLIHSFVNRQGREMSDFVRLDGLWLQGKLERPAAPALVEQLSADPRRPGWFDAGGHDMLRWAPGSRTS